MRYMYCQIPTWRGQDDAGPDVVKVVDSLEVADVLEDEGVVNGDLAPDLLVHGVDEGLVDGHALLGKRGGVVDGDVHKVGMSRPVLVQDEEELLGPGKKKVGLDHRFDM